MPLEYTIANQEGAKETLTVNDIVQQLQGQGEQVGGVSADGSTIKMQDAQGAFDVKTEDVLKQLGWQVNNVHPENANYEHVNNDWRAAISLLPHDDHRRAYLEGQFKRAGVSNPQVVGSGRDWYAFDPESNQYVALTNNPDFDKSDAVEAAVKLPRFLGSTIGGAAGAIAGGGVTPAAVALGAGGAAAGGALGDIPTRYLMAQRDPMLKEIMMERLGDIGKDVAIESGLDAIGGGLAPGIGMAFGKPAAQTFLKGGLSSAAKGIGEFAEAGGNLLNKSAKLADRPFAKEVTSMMIPGAGDMVGTGGLMQVPAMAVRGGAKGLGNLGKTQGMKELFPEAAGKLRNISEDLLMRSGKSSSPIYDAAKKVGSFLSGQPAKNPGILDGGVEDILGNLGEKLAGGGQRNNLYRTLRSRDIPAEEALSASKYFAEPTAKQASFKEAGRAIGRGVQNVEALGKGIENAGTALTGAVLKGARGFGYAGSKAGGALKTIGAVTQPLENKNLLRYGAEEFYSPQLESLSPWQDQRKREKMILANQ